MPRGSSPLSQTADFLTAAHSRQNSLSWIGSFTCWSSDSELLLEEKRTTCPGLPCVPVVEDTLTMQRSRGSPPASTSFLAASRMWGATACVNVSLGGWPPVVAPHCYTHGLYGGSEVCAEARGSPDYRAMRGLVL